MVNGAPDYWEAPGYRGGIQITSVVVLEVRWLDATGEIAGFDASRAAQEYNSRAFDLLAADELLMRAVLLSFRVKAKATRTIPSAAEHAARKIQQRNKVKRTG